MLTDLTEIEFMNKEIKASYELVGDDIYYYALLI